MNRLKNILSGIAVLLVVFALIISCSKKKKPFLFLPLSEGGSGTSIPIGDGSNPPASDAQTADAAVSDQTGESAFNFQTTTEITVDINVSDPAGPVPGAIVNITDPDQGGISLFQGVTDGSGNVTGEVSIPTTSDELQLVIQVGETVATQPIPTENLQGIDRDISFSQPTDPSRIVDADGDGVPDELDYYPHDITRAQKILQPAGGVAVIAYEDLYPTAGDADFNDLVVQVKNEEDRDARGKIVRVRGEYRILARGAGYKHNLFLNLPGSGVVHITVRDGSSQIVADVTRTLSSLRSLPVFPKGNSYFSDPGHGSGELFDSSTLCPGMCNVYAGKEIIDAYYAEIEVVFDVPVDGSTLSAAPYDLFIYVVNTQKEIHFPGMVAGATDPFIDSNGFPWGLKIPAEWNWPLEKNHIESGYPRFRSWYESRGATDRDWYVQTSPESSANLFRFFSLSPIAAYILQFGMSHQSLLWAFVSVMVTGLIVLLFLKGRSEYEA